MLITILRPANIFQSIAEVWFTGVAPHGAESHNLLRADIFQSIAEVWFTGVAPQGA